MNRQEFMAQLERLLWDIPENERQDAIAYYNDYFDEAGSEKEEKVIGDLGSPGKVAATIKADMNVSENEWATYTEHGYQDERTSRNENPLSKWDTKNQDAKGKVKIPLVLVIILLIFASPLILGLGGGFIGIIMGVFGALIGVIVAVVGGCIAGLVGGMAGLSYGITRLAFDATQGILCIGLGALAIAVGILLAILILWSVGKWLPALFRVAVNFIQRFLYKSKGGTTV